MQERIKAIRKEHGAKSLGTVTVEQTIGGMRGIPGILWQTSLLDPEEGIRFRGYSIAECQARRPGRGGGAETHTRARALRMCFFSRAHFRSRVFPFSLCVQAKLPAATPGGEPLPEGLFWLLLTGEIPTAAQAAAVSAEWRARAALPPHLPAVLAALPPDTHPMTQLCIAIAALQPASKFAAAYQARTHTHTHSHAFTFTRTPLHPLADVAFSLPLFLPHCRTVRAAQEQVLGAGLRGHDGPDCEAAGRRIAHLPPRVQEGGAHRA
jgi:citrate synthase